MSPSSKKIMLLASTLSIALGTLSLPGCSLLAVQSNRQNQFQSMPASATTPPQTSDFLTPYQNTVTQSDLQFQQNEQQTEKSLDASEQELLRSLSPAKSKPGT